ncbi:up-regulator of cell proliferation-like [Colossoma macropomum]|uniref:up-regulator of cell proliferation-like n=1 Tax=Colossoma macropomum TaxID=42526 RepID=UPI001864D140|nr:up-regulator of cell proliferation-like [Colossoma macropomum]XP_036423968.1 up-regulator of cell proliferation-like [Colossoma macropomum]
MASLTEDDEIQDQGSKSPQHHEEQNQDSLHAFLHTLGLEEYFPNKLSLRSLQEINKDSLSDKEVDSLQTIPWAFLRKLLMANSKSRTSVCASENDETNDLFSESDTDVSPNTLDLIVAIYACADSFLLQEMTLKMSMCQFAVPFLLPCGRQNQCTLMLWALRGILKEWRPHSMSESKGFVEESAVCAKIPLVSFVRLRNCSLSKSQVMNCLLSESQQHHDFFCHRDMKGGCRPRKIANGMVEMCWYLPGGNTTIDIFPEPVAIANLKGDVGAFETQFAFLTQVSNAIFVFLDKFEEREQQMFVSSQQMNSKLFFVVNYQRDTNPDVKSSIQTVMDALKLTKEDIIVKSQNVNMAKLADMICSTIKKSLSENSPSLDIESMSKTAQEFQISVDELNSEASSSAEQAAQNIMKGIGVREIVVYKKNQLPLQGENWKKLSQIEKEECRLQTAGDTKLEEYKAQLQEEIKFIQKTQSKYKITSGMSEFINAVTTNDSIERAFFLKWMGYKLDMRSRKYLSSLRYDFKEHCQQKDKDSLAKIDQQLLDSSLGLEHYMREMGHIYEASLGSSQRLDKLPTVAAELLQEGFPLELLDGDASSIPEKWINDVLMELHRMVGQRSRLLVLTVLGVQSTGKSTLLNTMFGVQFAVSSGRCTRGAYMLLLPLGEDLRTELSCDYILLIDTEGLKSADLAQLDNSYEHDNQLATFVIGLSDVTIINIAMENFTEMKDILQIAVHAFLRMRELGKKPICHFVHQNVAGVSAHNKLRTERQHLLEHLNEMTQIAATMEKKTGINKFTDVLDYDMELNNWYIPGLWNGTPPMAPVNTGYSVAVFDFKKNMLKTQKERNGEPFFNIPQFLEWMRSMWRAVKFENFIFSFQNTLVAHAYENLCKEFSEWEWSFKRHIYSWLESATIQISNAEGSVQTVKGIVEALNTDAKKQIATQEKEMKDKLKKYYKRKDQHVGLVERYKHDFIKNINSLQTEMQNTVKNKLDVGLQLKIDMTKVKDLRRKQAAMIEDQVLQLLKNCKGRKDELSDEDLKTDFESMWKTTIVNISGLEERDIPSEIMKELHSSLYHRKLTEHMENVKDLTEYGLDKFKVKAKKHFSSPEKNVFSRRNLKQNIQNIADTAIQNCSRMIEESAKSKSDYQNFLIKDLIGKIDEYIKSVNSKTNITFEVDLKLYICGIASRKFLGMHRRFLAEKDPLKHLEASKGQYLSDFIDLYRRKDQCQRKAQDFIQLCLKPAVTEHINQSIGTDIVDEILNSKYSTEYGSRSYFQYNILNELLEKEEFKEFVRYIRNYEIYVKDWIHEHNVQCFSKDLSLRKLKTKKLDLIVEKIDEAVKASQFGDDGCPLPNDTESTAVLIQNLCKALSKVISIPMDTVDRVLFQNTSLCTPFTKNLLECLNDLKRQLEEEIANSSDITETLNSVSVKPQNELFERVFGCGKQCPFCKAPCEAGGKDHRQHHAAVHRPQGLGGYRSVTTNILCEEVCTSSVHGKGTFKNHETNFQRHPYKDYHTYYPDWLIPPDRTIEASDYWKYVLVKYNDKFAEEYKAKPAVFPSAWNKIDKVQALEGLKSAFSIK